MLLSFLTISLGLATGVLLNGEYTDRITGSFTEASQGVDKENVYVEEVYWEFDSGKVVEGRVARQNFSSGTHNVTVRVEKSNGETEIHRGKIEVE